MWWLTNPLARKLTLGVAILTVVLFMLRWYGNERFNAGRENMKTEASTQLIKLKETQWANSHKALMVEISKFAAHNSELKLQAAQLDKERIKLDEKISSLKLDYAHNLAVAYQSAASVPDDQLMHTIWDLSDSLATKNPPQSTPRTEGVQGAINSPE